MDSTLRPLQQLVWLTQDWAEKISQANSEAADAISQQISLASSAASASRSAANEYRNIIKSLTDAQESIRGGGAAETQRFESLFAVAMTGDREALSALPGAADKLLAGSLASSRTALDYTRDQGKMLLALEQAKTISEGMIDWNEYHATLLETQVNVLEQIRDELAQENPNLEALERQAGLLESIGGLLQQQTTAIVNGNGEQVLLLHDQNGIITAANVLTTTQTGQIALGNSWLEKIKTGVHIESAGVINDYLKSVEQGLIGNNSAEAVAAREAISVLKQTTSDGLIAVSEAKATKEALAVLDQNNVAAQSKLLVAGSSAALQAMNDAATVAQAITSGTSTVTGTINLQRAEIINGNLIIRDQNGLIVSGNQLLVDQTGKITIGNELTNEQTAQVITGNATQDAIKNIQNLNTSYSEEMLNALISGETTQTSSLEGILTATTTTVGLIRQLVDLSIASEKEKFMAKITAMQSTLDTLTGSVLTAQTTLYQRQAEIEPTRQEVSYAAFAQAKAESEAARQVYQNIVANESNLFDGFYWTPENYATGTKFQGHGYQTKNWEVYARHQAAWSSYTKEFNEARALMNYSAPDTDPTVSAAIQRRDAAASQLNTAQINLNAARNEYDLLLQQYEDMFGERPPGYASGGPFSGGLRLVGEQGPELEYTGPSHIVNASKTEAFMSSNADLLAEIKKLNAKIDRLEAISYQTTKNTQKTAKTLEKFDYDGLPAERAA